MGKMRLLFIDRYLSYRDDALKDRFDCIINIRIKATLLLLFFLLASDLKKSSGLFKYLSFLV